MQKSKLKPKSMSCFCDLPARADTPASYRISQPRGASPGQRNAPSTLNSYPGYVVMTRRFSQPQTGLTSPLPRATCGVPLALNFRAPASSHPVITCYGIRNPTPQIPIQDNPGGFCGVLARAKRFPNTHTRSPFIKIRIRQQHPTPCQPFLINQNGAMR
jgi:hypothetical protein